MNGYCIRKTGDAIAPNIYYDENMSEDEIVDHVAKVYAKHGDGPDLNVQVVNDIFGSAEAIYDKVFPVLVNRDKNAEYLEDVVHRSFLDMEVIYKVKVFESESAGIGTVTIKNEHAEHFGMDLDKLHESAMKNLCGSGRVIGMYEMLMEMNPNLNEMGIVEPPEEEQMYIATNDTKINGASVIMLDDVLQKLHERLNSEDIVVLPSSIHEVIGVPLNVNDMDEDMLKSMVRDVNVTQVADEEVLSDSIYIHNVSGEWKVVA